MAGASMGGTGVFDRGRFELWFMFVCARKRALTVPIVRVLPYRRADLFRLRAITMLDAIAAGETSEIDGTLETPG
jgi:hypothetical protein